MRDQAPAFGRFDDVVAAVACHHEARIERVFAGQMARLKSASQPMKETSASTLAAQMKSLTDMPPTSCVLKRAS